MKKSKVILTSVLCSLLGIAVVVPTIVLLISHTKSNLHSVKNLSWQSGPLVEEDKRELLDESGLSYFFGDSAFNYATYKIEEDITSFYGDAQNVKRTKIYNREVNLWQNDSFNEQVILFKNNDKEDITDIKVEIIGNQLSTVSSHILNPIRANNVTTAGNDLIQKGDFITFDEVSNSNELSNMKYNFQPILLNFKSQDLYGSEDINIKIYYKVNDIQETINITKKINISQDFKLEVSEFGSSAMWFPNSSAKYVLKNLNDVMNVRTIEYSIEDAIDFENFNQLRELIKEKNVNMPQDAVVYDVTDLDKEVKRVWLKSNLYNYVTSQGTVANYLDVKFKLIDSKKEEVNRINNVINKIGDYDHEIIDDISRTLPRYLNEDTNINKNDIIGRKMQEMSEKSNFESISLPNFGLGNFIKYIFETEDENILNYIDYSSVEKMADSLENYGSWILDFKILDIYVKFLREHGITKLYIPMGSRTLTGIFNFFIKNQASQRAIQMSVDTPFVDSAGKITKDGKSILEIFIPMLRDDLSQHVIENQNIYEGMQLYYSFDEFSAEVNNISIDIFKDIDSQYRGLWKNHLYGGWQFNIKSFDYESLKELDVYDEITLQQREFIYNFVKSKKIDDLTNYFKDREQKDKMTHVYSSWNNWPAAYLTSNGYEMLWSMLFANKLGAQGYDRYQVDGYKNDISSDGYVLDPTKEPGDSFYIYPGDGENMLDSLRYQNMVNGVNAVNKINSLKEKDIKFEEIENILNLNKDSKKEIRYLNEKWNLNYYDNNKKWIDDLSGQSTYIEWLIKNYGF
ncbi:DUF4091 domain-containing protein [Spiroplasma culicicola]|uniref:Glycoside hydrolase 123 catalytic domain-containing protein n=1 Tax=Spiroplasma culicicola AES-1 TaxID=1276246 RepID=W6AHZ5_9MOLU|nr:DUF4091 domain-containing protein [Spiroplasma culicicola]AHI53319.1 hypothetical protein SCULI_v1c09790 [Spiroplasma culicicola AES-1]